MKKKYSLLFLPFAVFWLVQACTTSKPYYARNVVDWQNQTPKDTSEIIYSVFLIGDAGAPLTDKPDPTLMHLKSQIDRAGEKSAVVYLGDNIYHNGLPEPDAYDRKTAEERMKAQLDILKGYKGEKYMIPGNHDWGGGSGTPDGWNAVVREERFVEEYLADSNIVVGTDFFVPGNGCPGPFEVLVEEEIVLIALDSHWWLHPYDKPYGDDNPCGVTSEVDVLVQLEDIIQKNKDKNIVVVGHHPLFSNGIHGGYFTLTDHLFPLTILRKGWVLPLPVIGSIYPLARKYGGIAQDIPHPSYQAYINGLLKVFNKYDNIVYAAGHEHNLQYFKQGKLPHIVSGAGCKTQHVKNGGDALYAEKSQGYARINYYKNGEAWVEFWAKNDDEEPARLSFRMPMYAKTKPEAEQIAVSKEDYKDSTITVPANAAYGVGAFKKGLLGNHYRREWQTPVNIPMLDLQRERGGLVPYQKGGGKQTSSLKLRNEEGREYTLRSVNKDPTKVLPVALQETFARDLLQDQISAQHPYGALISAKLADIAGVYHTNPKLVYIPSDPRLRQYLDEFNNTVAFLEEDPDEDHSDVASLGNATNIIGTEKLLERKRNDHDNQVDEQEFARARLLDMLIGDWDRHEGQWRWVETRSGEDNRYYRPVPEDRDVAFFKADGIIPWLVSRRWAVRNFQHFGKDFGDYKGLNLTALTVDRTFLSSVTRDQWVKLANELKTAMTDQAIEEAVRQMPPEVYPLSGPELVSKLKSRRDLLPQVAEKYYLHLAEDVDITGSDKREKFEVRRLSDEETEVVVRKINKEGRVSKVLYQRMFKNRETEEIRLYGLGGDDVFEVTGNTKTGPMLRIIGGEGNDSISDKSRVKGPVHKTKIYDFTGEQNQIDLGQEAEDKTEAFEDVNLYDRDNYKIPYFGPRLSLEYNVDDGLFVGGGVLYRNHKFRKQPYASEHFLRANYAFATRAYNIRYDGEFKQVFNDKLDLGVKAAIFGPQYQINFFGLGNETEQTREIKDYRVRQSRMMVSPTLNTSFTHFVRMGIGPFYDRYELRHYPGRYVEDILPEEAFGVEQFTGVRAFLNLQAVSTPINPRIGLKWLNEFSYTHQLGGERRKFGHLGSEFMFYIGPRLPFQLTLAARLGGAHNIGDFPFYQANTLGGLTNLRGYRRTRFAGRTSVYQNTEIRMELFKFNVYLFPGKFGIMGLMDHGRVWADGESSDKIHRGWGGGIWIDVLKQAVINATYSIGEEDKLVNVNFGFLF
ncbi:metallophosphoesterase [Rufibacter sediminis]|uniref:Metallophosphoesterase n=1 Tax=Rufibacter sediminis TaxID=2762756 RepID=A0ABR6VVG5_9BACT|nr:metallophosphoesterase [Rufibacter sediminis]MBC3540930.1 metallophosphoesterase [Rufibacter sediminis]